MSTLKVDAIRHNSATSDAITTAADGTCTARITGITGGGGLSHRNIIINGAMRVAQRASSSTTNGYGDLDRWKHEYAGTDENPTFAQVALTTSDTPYTLGLTKTFKLTNGNQTSGLQSNSLINFNQQIEAQNIRNSGWNYTSSSSYITLSFWVRASVEQNYHGFVKTADGTNYIYPYETGTLSANTWTKITKSIPGNSNLTINDDSGSGFQVFPIFFGGANYTSSSVTNDAWANWSGGSGRSKDQANSWFTTNDATLEITGVQLEVGNTATSFEHRSFDDELRRCQRYYYRIEHDPAYSEITVGTMHQNGAYGVCTLQNPVPMRTKPSITVPTVTDAYSFYYKGTVNRSNTISLSGNADNLFIELSHTNYSATDGVAGILRITNASAYIEVHSEL